MKIPESIEKMSNLVKKGLTLHQAYVVYLRDDLKLSYKEITSLMDQDDPHKPISTYAISKKKLRGGQDEH
jgi:hypothetical protein